MFSVRLVTADSYQAQPLPQLDPIFSDFRGSEIKHVPIIRIFGTTSTGEKTCLHIHGIFPYLYVPYTGEEDPKSLAYRLAASLDAAINVSLGSATSNTQHVYLIQRVSGIPFYGYHRKDHQYLKIYFYNPAMIKRAADLLQNGSVLNQSLQPHEAHIPYILQFMIDYNVYGMSLVNLSRVKHRRLAQTLAELTSSGQSIDSDNSDIEYLPVTIERQSTCELEIDAIASDIMNRREVEGGLEFNPGLAAIWEEERARRVQAGFQGGDSQLVNPKSPPRPMFCPTDNDIYQGQRLARRLLMISQSDESTLSTTAHQSVAYAAEIREGESLLNSSYLPFSRTTAERSPFVGHENSTLHTTFLDSPTEVVNHRMSPESSILGTDDMSLVNLLDQLADEAVENPESIDMDSLLGSQVSGFLNDDKSDNENGDDDDDAVDLNLTSLQLDSMSSLEIATDKVNEPLRRDRNPLNTVDESQVISPYEISNSSRSTEEEKTKNKCRVPQYDGAGDVSPTLLDSDDEDNATDTKEFSHLPEYNSNVELASKSRKFDDLEQSLKIPLNNALVVSKDGVKIDECCPNSSLHDSHIDDTSVLPVLASDAYMPQYNGLSYEPLDRLLEIGPEFVPDLERLHSSMEIGILLSSADSDSPESVNEALENDTIPLETVLNGDPCFTESAELDKSDLTELQDQYDSLRGNSLLPNVHSDPRIDNDLGNSSNLSDSDYQTSEKPCEILLNVRSPRSPMTSRESSSSSENVAPNIQEPGAKSASRGKFNAIYALNSDTLNCKDFARMASDNSDYNSNVVVATWAELQNLQFVDKDKKDGRSGRSRDRGQHSQGSRQIRRRASRRSDERAASQILRLDSEKIPDNTISSASLQVNYNCSLSPRKLVVSESPVKTLTDLSPSPVVAEFTLVETKLTESLIDYVEERKPDQLSVPYIAAEVEIELDSVFEHSEIDARLDACNKLNICAENSFENIENSCPTICSIDYSENAIAIVNSEELVTNPLDKSDEPIKTKEFSEGFSYYSSERSERNYTIHGFEHRHCMLSKSNKIVQDEVFTSDQVWVIQKRKRGRLLKSRKKSICISGNCAIPIVPLTKINGKSDVSVTNVANYENIKDCHDSPIDNNPLETAVNQTVVSVIDTPVGKSNLSKYRDVARKTRVQRKKIDSSSSESSGDDTWSSSSVEKDEKNISINESIDSVIRRSEKKLNYTEISDFDDSMNRSFVEDSLNTGDSTYNRYNTRRKYSEKRKSIEVNSKRNTSTTTRASSSRNRLHREMSMTSKREVSLPGIPGNTNYRSTKKRGQSRRDVFNCHNGVVIDNKLTETPRKTTNKLQSGVLLNYDSERDISTPRFNGLVNGVQKGFENNQKNMISPNRLSRIDYPEFNSPHVSPIPKKNQCSRDTPKNFLHAINRSSTPKKTRSEIGASGENKMPEYVMLNLMIKDTKSHDTRRKLKMLLETRKKSEVSRFTVKVRDLTTEEKSVVSNQKPVSEIKPAIPIIDENPEIPSIPAKTVEIRDSIEEEIYDKKYIEKDADNLDASFETVTDNSETSAESCQPLVNSFGIVENTDIFNGTTLNNDLCSTEDDEVREILDADLEILGNRNTDVNPPDADEVLNVRKELSYRSDEFTSTTVETDFSYGNNYTIEAVSLEMPECLFEEDSNSVDKRSPKKATDSCLSNFNESPNDHDHYSDVSVDPRDLDVYDVESLTPSSSLVNLNETTADFAVTSLSISETTKSNFLNSLNTSETQTTSDKSQIDSKHEDIDTSFEEASPAFEALSPRPKISNFGKPLAEEFTSYTKMEITENSTKLNNSLTNTFENSTREARGGKWAVEDAELDHEIQDLVSQVVVQFENESESPCVIDFTPSNIRDRSFLIAPGSEIQTHDVEKPLTRYERKKETESEISEFFTIENRAQSRVFKSQREIQPTVIRDTEKIIRRPASNKRIKGHNTYVAKNSRVNNVNYATTEAERCITPCKRLVNISKVEMTKKSEKLRSVSNTMVNIDLSRFKGFKPKKCKRPIIDESKYTVKTGKNEKAEKLTVKNLLKSTPLKVFNEVDETIVPVNFELNQTAKVSDNKKKGVSGLTTLIDSSGKRRKIQKIILIKSPIKTNGKIKKSIEKCQKLSPETVKVNLNLEEGEKLEDSISKGSITSMKIPYVNEKIENSITLESTNPNVISEEGKKYENSLPIESSKPIKISNDDEICENPKSIEKSEKNKEFKNIKSIEKSEELKNDENSKSVETFKKNEEFVDAKPIEKLEESEKSKNPKPIEKSEKNENFKDTLAVELTTPMNLSDECVTSKNIIKMETKQPSQNSTRKRIEKISSPPERRSPRKCAEKTKQKLSQHKSSQPSHTESQPSSEGNSDISAENYSHGQDPSLREKSDDLPLQNGFISNFTKDCSTKELVEENSMQQNNSENPLETVLLTQNVDNDNTAPLINLKKACCSVKSLQENSRDASPEISASTEENSSGDELTSLIIMDENMKSETSFCPDKVNGNNGRFVRPKTKLKCNRSFRSTAQRRSNISLDSTTLVQQISVDETEQENTSYDRRTRQKNAETNTEIVNLDAHNMNGILEEQLVPSMEILTPESASVEAQENSLKSDLITEVIYTNTEFFEMSTQRNPATNTTEATVPKLSTVPAPLDESICDIAQEACEGIDLVSDKIVKQNIGEDIFLNADNSCGQLVFLESLSSSKENLADIIIEKMENSLPKIVEDKKRRSLPRKRRRRGKMPRWSRQKSSPKNNLLHATKTNYHEFDSSSEEITQVLTVKSSMIVRKKRQSGMNSDYSNNEFSSKASPLQDKSVDNTVEKIFENVETSSKLSRKMKNEDLEVTNTDNVDILQLNISPDNVDILQLNISPDKSRDLTKDMSQLHGLSPADIAKDSTTSIKTKRRGRPKKILKTNAGKSCAEIDQSVAKNSRATGDKALDIGKCVKATNIENKNSNTSDTNFDLNSQTTYSSAESLTDETAWYSAEEDITENDLSLPNNADKYVNSISNAVNHRLRLRKKLQDNTHVVRELLEKTPSTSQRRNHSEKIAEPNSSITILEISEIVIEESTRETQLLGQDETNTLAITPKRLGRHRKKLVLNSENINLNTADTDSQESDILSQKSDEEDIVHSSPLPKKRGRTRKSTKYPNLSTQKKDRPRSEMASQKSITEKSDEDAAKKIVDVDKASPQKVIEDPLEIEPINVKKTGRPVKKTSETFSTDKGDQNTKEKTLEVSETSSHKVTEKAFETEPTNTKSEGRITRRTASRESITGECNQDIVEKMSRESEALPEEIAEKPLAAETKNINEKGRLTRKTSNEESFVQKNDQDTEDKTLEVSEESVQKISDQTVESESIKIKKNGRPAKKTASQESIAEKNNQKILDQILKDSEALPLEMAVEPIEDKSINVRGKDSPSTVEGCQEIEENISKSIELSCQKLIETNDIESKSSPTSRRSSRLIKNQEDAPKIILSKNKKKTQSEENSEAESENSNASEESVLKISDQTFAQDNLLSPNIAKDSSKIKTIVRPRKRVRLNENENNEKIDKSPPYKHRKLSPNRQSSPKTVKTRNKGHTRKVCNIENPEASEDLSTIKDIQTLQDKEEISEPENDVTEKREYTSSSSDNDSLHSLPLYDRFFEIQKKKKRRSTKTITQSNDSEIVGPTTDDQILTNLSSPVRQQRLTTIVQSLQKPIILLKRLNRESLTTYGFKFNAKEKIFVKNQSYSDYEVPAYDGAADLSSSESDEDPADVTIAREEKRVCVYQSSKKSAANTKREAIFTPKKRKIDDTDEVQSSTRKHRTLATPGTSSKTPYRSPSRTSMLKSPGRVSGYYPRLKIIVTSPKVRKETSEPQNTEVRLENHDVPTTIGACLTPRRKNSQSLHENVLRGRTSSMKLPKNDIGDKSAPIAMTGSQRPGELDEIKSSEQSVRNTLGITSECRESIGNQNLTATLKDGKDVRKKLVFTIAEDQLTIDKTHETPSAQLKLTNLIKSGEPRELFPTNNDAGKSLEIRDNFDLYETIMLDPQPGPSNLCQVPVDENQLYDVTTDEDSENDDDVCNVTFTQYIDSQIEKNQILTLDRRNIGALSNGIVSLRPKFNPPNRQRIIDTMETYGIPKYRNQEPFFSDETDVPKQKELAQKMLKVPGKGLKDLQGFVSALEGVTGLARWRKMKINEFQPALAKVKGVNMIRPLVGDARVSLTPLIKPPTQKDVKNWLRAREYLQKKKSRQEEIAKESEVGQKIEVHASIDKTEEDECESSDMNVTVIEASPEKIIGSDDSENALNRTLRMKLAKRRLVNKAEDLKNSELTISEIVGSNYSVNASELGEEKLINSNSNDMDPSLLSVLQKSRLFKDQEASRHLGVSFGQIEFLSDSTRSNVSKENLQNVKALTRHQYLTIMCLEVHVTTRGDLLPNAQHDSIAAIFYSVQSDVPPSSSIKPLEHGVIVLAEEDKTKNKMHYSYASNIPWSIFFANNEEALLNALVTLVTRTDPEILIGWELETLSWGYVFQRASRLGMDLSKQISRIPTSHRKWDAAPAPDTESMADVKLPGRIVLDIWRIMRSEAALLSYTFESLMHHVLNERVSCPSFKILTDWWNLERCRASRWRVVEHYSIRVLGVFRILDHLDIIGRTSELARLFGIQFYEVFSRGSQFRVESVMLRLAKPLNYIPVSPSPMQRASMRAMEALPLILEPESMFYSDPLIVLDFQSLYPSIIIAHNYCFSTCLGRVEHIGQPQPFEFGAYSLRVSKNTAMNLRGKVNYAPCGVAFVKSEVRLGILPRMLTEILNTRFMVKKAMKDHKQADKTLQRALHSRQLGLKFLANVTYGYTAANFSGRMPCIEVGDSVISKSKGTLERAIKLVEATPKWGARVVYGDTDSLFILVPGKSKADAFIIGNEIADAVTASNPPPIKLRFEKVMYPSILQTKKRYCGYMYETPDQETPTYLAKGIETVRRDGCPAVSKVLEKTLKILFETKDVSLVKKYVTRQLDKVLRGKVSIQDLTFAKEFRGLKGYSAKACVPALELTRRLMRKDPRAIPRNSERVRYVIVAGAPNQALIHCVRTPWELINDPGLRPNAIYYVTRVIIPPLNRCLNLMGVDVNAWYREMPHRQILDNPVGQPVDKQKLTIFQYFGTIVCVSCGQPSSKGICMECLAQPADTLVVLHDRFRSFHRTYDQVIAICQSCVGQTDAADCSSLDCPVLYRRAQAQRELSQATHLRSIIECGNNFEF